MSNPLEQQHVGDGERNVGGPALPGAATRGGDGPAASVAADQTRPAGTSTSQPVAASTVDSSDSPMELLRSTVENLERQGSSTFAAGVASRMRQTDPAFDLKNYGFKSFKAFLERAAADGVVKVVRPPGASDLAVSSVGGSATPLAESVPAAGRYLRRDVWSALTRTGGPSLWWCRETGELVGPLNEEPANAGSWVELAPLPRDEVIGWMQDFVATLDDPERAMKLNHTLKTASGYESFTTQVRGHQGTARKWGRFYRDHVMRHAFTWADANSVPRENVLQPAGRHPAASSPDTPSQSRSATIPASTTDAAHYERRVRAAVASAVERMPLADLLRLPIPAEYLIRM